MKQCLFGLLIIYSIFLVQSCKHNEQKFATNNQSAQYDKNYEIWADTIIYDVVIHNTDSTDEWQSHKIKDLNRKKMIDDIFSSVYSGQKKAYNYYTNKAMDIDDIKILEENNKRENVGKVQFSETWYYNAKTGAMEKKIYNILIAYELYNSNNELRGYKAAFYVKNN